jgi:hypothetical protein
MARGTQFQAMVYMLRAEIRRSTNVGVGVDDLPELKQALNREYAIQWARHEWPFLTTYFGPLQLNMGQKLYNLPAGLSYDRIKSIAVFYSGVPQRLERGISFEDYALFDGDSGAYSDPVLKWDIRAGTNGQEQIEFWPVPSSQSQTAKFFGYVGSPYMVNDTDLCAIDDLLVVLYAAAGLMALDESEPRVGLPPAAQMKLTQADAYYTSLISNAATARRTVAIGQGHKRPAVDTNSLVRVRG